MSMGTVGFGAYLAGKLGLSAAGVAPLAAIYATAQAASKPLGTLEAFARVASAVQKLNNAIPKGAKTAFDGLLKGTKYGAKAGLYDLVKEHVLANQLTANNKDRADNWNDATHKVTGQINSLIANPEQSASQIGNAWGPLPPQTRAAGVAKANNILNYNSVNRPKMQPSPSILKPGTPRMTPTDALKAARLYHLTTAPIQALGEHLVNRDLTPADVAAAQAAFPETTAKWQSSLMEHAMKEKNLSLDVQSQLAIATGRPAWPIGYSVGQQSGYGSTGPSQAPPAGGNVPSKGDKSRKFQSEQANAERLPSSKPVT